MKQVWRSLGIVAVVLAMALVAAGCGGDEEEATETTAIEHEAENGASEPGTDDGAVTEGEAGLPSGFPTDMPLPAGTDNVREDMATGGYSAFVPGRDFAEVIAELETALPASGWNIVEQTADIGTRGDMLFTVEGHGSAMQVFVEPYPGSEEDTHVVYFAPQ